MLWVTSNRPSTLTIILKRHVLLRLVWVTLLCEVVIVTHNHAKCISYSKRLYVRNRASEPASQFLGFRLVWSGHQGSGKNKKPGLVSTTPTRIQR
eukprot:4586623-Prymnesium_polylepis.1